MTYFTFEDSFCLYKSRYCSFWFQEMYLLLDCSFRLCKWHYPIPFSVHKFINCVSSSLLLFLKYRPTFRRIIRNRSIEEFSGLPYVYALLNCLITLWYGTPFISPDNISVVTVNSIGAAFQLVYITLYVSYANRAKKVSLNTLYFCFRIALMNFLIHISALIFMADANGRTSTCSVWHIRNHSIWELADSWCYIAPDRCWTIELCCSHINVCFSIVYNCESNRASMVYCLYTFLDCLILLWLLTFISRI